MLRQTLAEDGEFDLQPAALATQSQVLRVHTPEYVQGFLDGTLESSAMRRIGFPWSPGLVTRTLASAGGTLAAARQALVAGMAGTLAGGTHHAFRGEGSGFCVFNDLAIAIEDLRLHSRLRRFAVADFDVHQGDGTASIFANDLEVFTLSVHGRKNFPFRKQQSKTLDIELEDGILDDEYLKTIEAALAGVWQFSPDFILYQSGVDGLDSDRLGRLKLTVDGLRRRDEILLHEAWRRSVPITITLGGGYSNPIGPTVEAHSNTFRVASKVYTR